MFILSTVVTYATLNFAGLAKAQIIYVWGFIFGRAFTSTLLSLTLVCLPLLIIQGKQIKLGKISYITGWVLLVILNILLILNNK